MFSDLTQLSLNNPSPNWPNQTFLPAIVTRQPRNGATDTRIVVMSDTHGKHRSVAVPKGDILIHAGDMTRVGETSTLNDLNQYFHELAPRFSTTILAIAGNHDITLHPEYYATHWQRYHRRKLTATAGSNGFTGCHYLQDSEILLNEGRIRVYGSPWTPFYFDWAFNLKRGTAIRDKWKQIPDETDILITHGPPLGRLDKTIRNIHAGCEDLLHHVQHRVRPRLHIFGHIHEGYGSSFDGHTLYVNGSNVDFRHQVTNPCIVIDLPNDTSLPAKIVQPVCRIESVADLQAWFMENDGEALATLLNEVDEMEFGSVRHGLLKDTALMDMVDLLRLHRETALQKKLKDLLGLLYAESFY